MSHNWWCSGIIPDGAHGTTWTAKPKLSICKASSPPIAPVPTWLFKYFLLGCARREKFSNTHYTPMTGDRVLLVILFPFKL